MIVNRAHLYAVPFPTLVLMVIGQLLRERASSSQTMETSKQPRWPERRVAEALNAGELPDMEGPAVLKLEAEDIAGLSVKDTTLLVEKTLVAAFDDVESNRLVARMLPPVPECKIRRIRNRRRCHGSSGKSNKVRLNVAFE